jgi:hypothetical protein
VRSDARQKFAWSDNNILKRGNKDLEESSGVVYDCMTGNNSSSDDDAAGASAVHVHQKSTALSRRFIPRISSGNMNYASN